MELESLGQDSILNNGRADVAQYREGKRMRRLAFVALVLAALFGWIVRQIYLGAEIFPGLPKYRLTPTEQQLFPALILVLVLGAVLLLPLLGAGRSPHVLYRPSEISIGFSDVVGLGVIKDEVVRTLNLFLAYKTFHDRMGGETRRAILFEGPPGTGKTYMAKAMAHEAGVPFLFVSSSAFQSMFYGQTNRKIRAYFKALRKAARREGGAIGFIEEIDAIAGTRSGMNGSTESSEKMSVNKAGVREGVSGVVNELLIQLQSFDHPTFGQRIFGIFVNSINIWLPRSRHLKKRPPRYANILVIGATNRAADLDPALLRPGRFDRSIHFDLPGKSGRREIIDYYLGKKAHDQELDKDERRDQIAAMTAQYSPVMIEHMFNEGLIWALRGNREAMTWEDVQQAKLTEEIGLKQPVEYTDEEKKSIATHESGHAVIAYLVSGERRLEVLSIIKRRDALGLLAHSDMEERFTKSRSELLASIQIAFGGMTAEELFFGESGTGPGSDLAAATKTAAMMVGSFGMAGSLISFDAVDNSLMDEGLVGKVLADEHGRAAMDRILNQAKEDVRVLLDHNRYLVVALRDALLLRNELVGDEIITVIKQAELDNQGLASGQ